MGILIEALKCTVLEVVACNPCKVHVQLILLDIENFIYQNRKTIEKHDSTKKSFLLIIIGIDKNHQFNTSLMLISIIFMKIQYLVQ